MDFKPEDVAGAVAGVGVVGLILRAFYKLVSKDVREAKNDAESDGVIGQLRELVSLYKTEADVQRSRADGFAAERNKAIQEVGELKGEVASLRGHVEELEERIRVNTEQMRSMSTLIDQLRHMLNDCEHCTLGRERRNAVEVGDHLSGELPFTR